MKNPLNSLPPLNVDPAKIQKVGVAAVGIGSVLLVASDPKLRRRLKGELAGFTERLQKHIVESSLPSSHSRPISSQETSTGVVYLLKAGPFYKIGKTMDFAQRIRQIRLQLPYKVEIVHQIHTNNITHTETYWHRRFASRRQNGEWFVLTDEEVAEFKRYSRM